IQTLAMPAYRAWKRGLVVHALAQAGVEAEVGPLVDAHGEGRRRATFHARVRANGRAEVGFMRARAHEIIEIEHCPLLAPSMEGALCAARALAEVLVATGKPLDIVVTATGAGLDVDLRGTGALADDMRQALIEAAGRLDLARLSNHGETIIARRQPFLAMGRSTVVPSPGAFLQATAAGEEELASRVCAAVAGRRRVLDLFAGIGTFALRLAETADVHAVETDGPALAALERAAHATRGLRSVTVERRDLFRRPLAAEELGDFDAAVLDPPRAGAEMQARALAAAKVAILISVSCNAQSFARDAAILTRAGYRLLGVTPIDQFRHTHHVEIVGIFEYAKPRGRHRRLLG
ncbi:MAG TPA: RNA methyltransferase, partial [Beijerinckiaceae bacterium]|nr:RNA methyltransferase [Beijerinckiaceae bacterium]